jgi:hypothetical protein
MQKPRRNFIRYEWLLIRQKLRSILMILSAYTMQNIPRQQNVRRKTGNNNYRFSKDEKFVSKMMLFF